jgi:hypothetical protein
VAIIQRDGARRQRAIVAFLRRLIAGERRQSVPDIALTLRAAALLASTTFAGAFLLVPNCLLLDK